MVWGEHCVECAAPACFKTCDLYDPRPDGRCRRFRYGMVRNRAFNSFRGYGAEILIRKWGKLEARGNTAMEPARVVLRRERHAQRLARWLNRVGKVLQSGTRDARWRYLAFSLLEKLNRRLHRTNPRPDLKPDLFLLEIYNPGNEVLYLTLHMGVARASLEPEQHDGPLPPPFSARLALEPGYTCQRFPYRLVQAIADSGLPFDISLVPEESQETHLVILSADFISEHSPAARAIPAPDNVKCVVWDLDNTLWDGVLLESEPQGLRPGVADLLRHFDERGILQSIASKNDHQHAYAMLERLGVSGYFLCPQINWGPKSESIKTIAKTLNIGVDSLAFIDDNPFELAEVAEAVPNLSCRHADGIAGLYHDPLFQGSSSAEARQRRQFYQEALVREQVQSRFGDDYLGFLATCAIEVDVHRYQAGHLERVAELAQRTNQLNFSGHKYQRDDLLGRLADPTLEKYVIDCRDKFGSYGTVGFSLVRRLPDAIRIEEFMLSCRVQGKFVEQAFFHYLVGLQKAPLQRIEVNFRATDRNRPAQQTLNAMHFAPINGIAGLALDLECHPLRCDFIQVNATVENDTVNGP